MPKIRILVQFATFALLSGCLSMLGLTGSKGSSYQVPSPGLEWDTIDPGEANFAYRNRVDQAILNVSSVCGEERFRPLEELSEDVLQQLPERTTVQVANTTLIGGHPCLITEVLGLVDGHGLTVRLAIVRTPSCLFDIMLVGKHLDASSRKAFDAALSGFRERLVP